MIQTSVSKSWIVFKTCKGLEIKNRGPLQKSQNLSFCQFLWNLSKNLWNLNLPIPRKKGWHIFYCMKSVNLWWQFNQYYKSCKLMLTLVFGMSVSKGKVNRSLDFCLIAKETKGDCEQEFIKYSTSYIYKLITLQVAIL